MVVVNKLLQSIIAEHYLVVFQRLIKMSSTESLVQYNAPVLVSSDNKNRENTRKNTHLLTSSSDINLTPTIKKQTRVVQPLKKF